MICHLKILFTPFYHFTFGISIFGNGHIEVVTARPSYCEPAVQRVDDIRSVYKTFIPS